MASLRVGMVVDPVGSYGRGVIRGISAFANGKPNWSVVIEPRWSFETPLAASDWNVDGMLVQVYSGAFEAEVAERGRRLGFPVVNVSNFIEGISIPTVVPDDRAIGALAAEYLRSKGFGRLGYFGPLNSEFSRLRMAAFQDSAAKAGITIRSCDPDIHDVSKWLRTLVTPVAVLGSNDDWAHRLIEACKRVGLRVPDDVAVLGVDDDELINSLVSPSLSSVPTPAVQVGYEAARMLDELMRPGSAWLTREDVPGKRLLVPPTASVVTRQSTDVLAVEDDEVASAVKYIRDRAGEPIDVEDVLAEVAVSRRALERRFKSALGRGVGSEIRRVRLARAKQLLAETELSMPDVAEKSGFGSATRLGIVFRQTERMTPTRYRQFARGLEAPQG